MKRYLLTGGFAAALLLGACSGEESGDVESTEEGATEESEAVDESLEERVATLEAENEELQAENEQLSNQLEEVAQAPEQEEGSPGSDIDSEEDVEEDLEGAEEIKTISSGFEQQFDTINVKLLNGAVGRAQVTEDEVWLFDNVEEPGEIDIVALEFEVENTADAPKDFYLSYATMVTNTNQQVESETFVSEGLESEMLGEVTSTGTVLWVIEDGTAEDIEWIDLQIPAVADGETYDNLSEAQTVRIEFE